MKPVLMKFKTDCEVSAIATTTETTYQKAKNALNWKDLPGGIENPVFGNPINLYMALINLGFWKRNIKFKHLVYGIAKPNKTIVLVHRPEHPTTQQHWIVWAGLDDHGNHLLFWGDSEKPVVVPPQTMSAYFHRGWPNCAFEVYKASIWKILWLKFKRFFNL